MRWNHNQFVQFFGLSFILACQSVPVKQTTDESWRNKAPEPGAFLEPQFPKFQKAVLPNGLVVMLAEKHDLPLVSAQLVVNAGSARESAHQAGLAQLTGDMLEEGAGALSGLELSDAFLELGAITDTIIKDDFGVITLNAQQAYFEKSLSLLSQMAMSPRFEKADFARVKKQNLTQLDARASQPGPIAADAFLALAYGPQHPYGHPTAGTTASVHKLSLENVKSFHRSYYVPNNAGLIVAGDITLEEAKVLATRYFGHWKARPVKALTIPAPHKHPKGPVMKITDRASSPQTMLVLGSPTVDLKSASLDPAELLSEVTAGLFNSRLNMNLRQEKQWTYGVGSRIYTHRKFGSFMVQTSIQVPYTVDALAEILREFANLQRDGVTADELEAARNGLLRSFLGSFESCASLASSASFIFINKLPLDYYNQRYASIARVTQQDVKRAAERILSPANISIVAVGDASSITPSVKTLKLGKLIY